jgi:hypothetical protein
MSIATSITGQQTTSVQRQYAQSGGVNATFWTYNGSASSYVPATSNVLQLHHTGVPVRGGYTTTTLAAPEAGAAMSGLFPFTGPYTAFSGACASNANLPASLRTTLDTAGYGQAAQVNPGSTTAIRVFEPAINPIVTAQGPSGSGNGYIARAAPVVVRSTEAACPSTTILQTETTGLVPPVARSFPYGNYTVCAESDASGTMRFVQVNFGFNDQLTKDAQIQISRNASAGTCPR